MKKQKAKDVETTLVEKDIIPTKDKKKRPFARAVRIFILKLILLIVILAAFFVLLQEPRVKKYYIEFFGFEQSQEIIALNNKIGELTQAVEENKVSGAETAKLLTEFNALNRRFELLEESNSNTIKSKADVALVLGIIGRLDNIENKVTEVAKVSDRGALLATAAALVKDAAERGGEFAYEAAVLEQLAKDENRISTEVETIVKYANTGISSEDYLSREFEKIYKESFASKEAEQIEEGDGWRAKFNKKFGKIITIKVKKTGEEKTIQEENLDTVMYHINNQEFRKAVRELNDPKYADILAESELLRNWQQQAMARVAFFDAVSKVSAYSLAVMKVGSVR